MKKVVLVLMLVCLSFSVAGASWGATGTCSEGVSTKYEGDCSVVGHYGNQQYESDVQSYKNEKLVQINFVGNSNVFVSKRSAADWQRLSNAMDKCQYSVKVYDHFCCRVVAGTNTISNHAYGEAIDININKNPYVNGRSCTSSDCDIPSCVLQAIKDNGFGWGGAWKNTCDAQHIEWKSNGVSNINDVNFCQVFSVDSSTSITSITSITDTKAVTINVPEDLKAEITYKNDIYNVDFGFLDIGGVNYKFVEGEDWQYKRGFAEWYDVTDNTGIFHSNQEKHKTLVNLFKNNNNKKDGLEILSKVLILGNDPIPGEIPTLEHGRTSSIELTKIEKLNIAGKETYRVGPVNSGEDAFDYTYDGASWEYREGSSGPFFLISSEGYFSSTNPSETQTLIITRLRGIQTKEEGIRLFENTRGERFESSKQTSTSPAQKSTTQTSAQVQGKVITIDPVLITASSSLNCQSTTCNEIDNVWSKISSLVAKDKVGQIWDGAWKFPPEPKSSLSRKCSLPINPTQVFGFNNNVHTSSASGHGVVRTNNVNAAVDLRVGSDSSDAFNKASSGIVVKSPINGKISEKFSLSDGSGECIIIVDSNNAATLCHISSNVDQGQTVNSGQTVGSVTAYQGNFGPHLHLELKINGNWIQGDGKRQTWDKIIDTCN